MSLFFRTNAPLKEPEIDNEFNNIVTILNNLDSTTISWTNVKVGTLTSTTSTVLKGTSTNDSAASGNVGEYLESTFSNVSFAATNTWGDATTLALTAGDWDMTYMIRSIENGGTWSNVAHGISTTSGNSSTGLTMGTNANEILGIAATVTEFPMTIASFRVSLASTTTYYAKFFSTYSAGQPQASGRISARRVR